MALTRRRFLSGVRGLETTIYEVGLYPFGYIGPIFVIWRAIATAPHDSQPVEEPSGTSQPTSKRKRKRAKKSSGEETTVKLSAPN
jgi:hypothetical protein